MMRSLFFALACIATMTAAMPVKTTVSTSFMSHTELEGQFEQFITTFSKSYKTAEEKLQRFAVFVENFNFIHSWNSHNKSFTGVEVAINEFADLSHEEFKSFYLGYRPSGRRSAKTHYGNPTNGCLPDEQPVRIQGLSGDFCSPDCTSSPCPTDVPAGDTAKPQCALKASSGNDKKCALICSPSTEWAALRAGDAQCGAGTCQPIQGVGICTYGAGPAPPTPPGPPSPPSGTCDVPTALQCGEGVLKCIATCKTGIMPCAKCLYPDFKECCPCLEKLDPNLPAGLCGAGPTPTPPTPPTPPGPPTPPSPAGDSVDWVAKGAVTPVKNQAHCGSCWAFSTTGGLEGAIFVKHNVLESLSEEELVQCDKVDHGCKGGAMDNGFSFIKKSGGLALESTYPYTSATGAGLTGSCVTSKESPKAQFTSTVNGFTDVTQNSEPALKAAVALHPVSVAIEADKQVFQFYKTGVLKASAGCGTKLDHGVLAVGYGVESGTKYWKVKNSWGPTWGDAGYIKLERTDASGSGTCGIAMDASYPNLA